MIKAFSYLQSKHGISRREYMHMLQEKAVIVNKKAVESMLETVAPGDTIEVISKGKILLSEKVTEIQKKEKIMVLFNKPKGYAVSKEDKHNKTIYELFPKSRQKDFYYIGRLDKDSHGLLLLTNDPALVDFYEKPGNKINKVYEVQLDKPIKTNDIAKAKRGIPVDENGAMIRTEKGVASNVQGDMLKADNITYVSVKDRHYAIITLTEGKKRHIRRMMKALGYTVKDLKRTKVGKYQLGSIKPGKYMLQKFKESMTKYK